MSDGIAIQVRNVTKRYKLYDCAVDRLKESLHPLRKRYHRDFYALNDVSFEVKRGETLGIIGKNGCGKSTLLKIVAGVLTPTRGDVSVRGRVSALLELGTGFNPELTGMENIYFSGAIMGFGRKEMHARVDDIVSFADIGEFIGQPVKTYSSGMFVRLAFAVATSVSPEVLIIDEVLSVGDIFFQQKCHALMEKLIHGGTSVVIVSHDIGVIRKYSTRVMVLDRGRSVFWGEPGEGVARYYGLVNGAPPSDDHDQAGIGEAEETDALSGAHGDGLAGWPPDRAFPDMSGAVNVGDEDRVRCVRAAVCNLEGEPCTVFDLGETAVFFTEYLVLKDVRVPVGGITIFNRHNLPLYAKSSLHYSVPAPGIVRAGSRIRFRQEVELSLSPDEYTFCATFSTMDNRDYIHAREMEHMALIGRIESILRVVGAGSLTVKADRSLPVFGYVDLPGGCSMSVIPGRPA